VLLHFCTWIFQRNSLLKMYYHGESINVNVQATNNSNKTVKKIRISGKKIKNKVKSNYVIQLKHLYLINISHSIGRNHALLDHTI
jgi:hypothetical protein